MRLRSPAARPAAAVILAAVILAHGSRMAADAPDREHRVKAVFLYNFAQFVEWPDSAFPDPKSPLVIGILGDDPFREFLDEVVAGEAVAGHPLAVRRFRRLEDVEECQVLYVDPATAERLDGRIGYLQRRGILTVGESRHFLDDGGMVQFVRDGGRVRFRINRDAVRQAGIPLSSKLLRLAELGGPRRD